MSGPRGPTAPVFEVEGTRRMSRPPEPRLVRRFGDARTMRERRAHLTSYSQTTRCALHSSFGHQRRRSAHGRRDPALGGRGRGAGRAEAADRARPAQPDVAPAPAAPGTAGFRTATRRHAAPGPSPPPLDRAGLEGVLERAVAVQDTRRFQPAAETARSVADALGADADDLCVTPRHPRNSMGAPAAACWPP